MAYRVSTIRSPAKRQDAIVGFRKEPQHQIFVSEQIPADLESLDKLATDYGITV